MPVSSFIDSNPNPNPNSRPVSSSSFDHYNYQQQQQITSTHENRSSLTEGAGEEEEGALKEDHLNNTNNNNAETDPLQILYNDPTFTAFLRSDFDADEHANEIIQGLTISASLSRLSHGLGILDKEIHAQVVAHHTDLLQQATGIQKVERVLDVVKSRVGSLQLAIDRIQLKINEPYKEISLITLQLTRLQTVCMYLRKVTRFIYLSRRLRGQLTKKETRDIAKAASTMSEIDAVLCCGEGEGNNNSSVDLSGICVVDSESEFIRSSKIQLMEEGGAKLKEGIINLNQSEVATALQVFFNLNCLSDKAAGVCGKIISDLSAQVRECLNLNALNKQIQHEQQAEKLQNMRNKMATSQYNSSGSASNNASSSNSNVMGSGGSSSNSGIRGRTSSGDKAASSNAALRSVMWARLEVFFDELATSFMKILHLSRVLAKTKDPLSTRGVTFMELLVKSEAFDEIVMSKLLGGRPGDGVDESLANGDTFSFALLEEFGVYDVEGSVAKTVHLDSRVLSHDNLLLVFWHIVTSRLARELNNACKHSNFLKNTFEGEYPKLLTLVQKVWQNIDEQIGGKFGDGSRKRVLLFEVDISKNPLSMGQGGSKVTKIDVSNTFCSKMLLYSVYNFETQYLARSLGRIYDPINSIFPSGSKNPPRVDDVGPILDAIQHEIDIARIDESLLIKMCKNCAKAIKMFTVKSEHIVSTEADAYYVSGPATITLKRNILLINCLYQMYMEIKALCSRQAGPSAEYNGNGATGGADYQNGLPEAAISYLLAAADSVYELIEAVVNPLFDAITHRLEEILYGLIETDFFEPDPESDQSQSIFQLSGTTNNESCSAYIAELSRSIIEINAEILGRFKNCEAVIRPHLVKLMERLLVMFVRIASLIPNLGEKGKLVLAGDMAQLEHALSPLQYGAGVRVSDLGMCYRALRSLRPLMFLELNQILTSPAVGETLPVPVVLHHLIGRGPSNLQQPYVLQNEHVQVYSSWLDGHNEQEKGEKEAQGAGALYIILDGSASVYKRNPETKKEVYIAQLEAGDFSGFGSVVDEDFHTATAASSKDTSSEKPLFLARIASSQLRSLVKTHPGIGIGLVKFMTKRLKIERCQLSNFSDLNVESSEDKIARPKKRICFFDSQPYWEKYFNECSGNITDEFATFELGYDERQLANLRAARQKFSDNFQFKFLPVKLTRDTALMASGCQAVCIFVNDSCTADVIEVLHNAGVDTITLRCAGFNNVSLPAAQAYGMRVTRVPDAVAEFALSLLMSLNRHVVTAACRTRTGNFQLHGLDGFDIYGKTVGVVGTGKIGCCFAKIMLGMGCKVLCYDLYPNAELKANPNVTYVDHMDELLGKSDVISLHAPLVDSTYHCINAKAISKMKRGVLLLNTSRGGLVDARALIEGLKSHRIAGAGLDVYEDEREYFFNDTSDDIIKDDTLARLLAFNNVIITSHQAFFTSDALRNIALSTCESLKEALVDNVSPQNMTNNVCPFEQK
eukprot:Nk52_evm69s158 gene=Nk52_evmTU69s158